MLESLIWLGVGIALGAAFSPFWMKLWDKVKAKWDSRKD